MKGGKYIVDNRLEIKEEDLHLGDMLHQDGNNYRFLHNEIIYDVKLLAYDKETKIYQLKINGFHIEVKELSQLDQLIAKLGFNEVVQKELKEITAPMPGLVKKIFVKEGEEIVQGQNLLILEAMKMENIIKASGSGKVTKIIVGNNEKVEKGKVLIKL